MAGHSKWNNIRFRKEGQDKAKSRLYHKYSSEIKRLAKINPNPDINPQLRAMLQICKNNSIPKHIIEKALNDKESDGEILLYEVMFEHYPLIIKCRTNNKNKSAAEIKSILNKYGGNLSKCLFAFKYQSMIVCDFILENVYDLIDDFEEDRIICSESNLNKLIALVSNIKEITTTYFPIEMQPGNDAVEKIIEKFEELEYVEEVISNID